MTDLIRFYDRSMTTLRSLLAYSWDICLDNHSGIRKVFKRYKSACSLYPRIAHCDSFSLCIKQDELNSSKSICKMRAALEWRQSSFKKNAIVFLDQILKIKNTEIDCSLEITPLQNILLGLLDLSYYVDFRIIPSKMFEGTLH